MSSKSLEEIRQKLDETTRLLEQTGADVFQAFLSAVEIEKIQSDLRIEDYAIDARNEKWLHQKAIRETHRSKTTTVLVEDNVYTIVFPE